MIISPPFLPNRASNQLDAEWLTIAMNGGMPGQGGFPVSHNLGWHGGIHLTAPAANATTAQPIRALADGKVVFVKKPTTRPDPAPADHPLNYRNGWTSDGCIILRHDTEIGASATGVATTITYYSIITHLHSIRPQVIQGKAVYRKDALGQAGYIYGEPNRTHMEIICDDTNLTKLVGRSTGKLAITQDGRTDAVYGEIYFHLPAGTPIYGTEPLPQLTTASRQPPKPSPTAPLPAIVALSPVYISTDAMIIGLRYASGEGPISQRGDALLTSYTLNGEAIGTALREPDAEYNLYSHATKISKAYPDNAEPAPSAVYELLRFGRIINTANETLTPATAPHWRKVNYPGGSGWVNLNATGITKYSDADFPHWQGWTLIDDDTDINSQCNSPTIKAWLDANNDGKVTPNEAHQRLSNAPIQDKLKRTICKFPTEWEKATVEQRWGWLKTQTEENPAPLTADDFGRLKAHIEALCFWEDAGMTISSKHWHFQPREFIGHMRRCGWLSARELVRCIPATYQTEAHGRGSAHILARISQTAAQQRVSQRDPAAFMKVCRKYGVDHPQRLAHFLAQIFRETGVLQYSQELASGAEYEGREELGNIHLGDGVRFKGRGLMQTTGRRNYDDYGNYRGKSFLIEPNNFLISTDAYNCVDTAGLYWVRRNTGHGAININRLADIGAHEQELRTVTKNVNGAEDGMQTGLFERRSHLLVLRSVLSDELLEFNPEVERRHV